MAGAKALASFFHDDMIRMIEAVSEPLRRIDFDLNSASEKGDASPARGPGYRTIIQVLGPNRLISQFAAELGEKLQAADIFLSGDTVVVSDHGISLKPIRPVEFVSWLEQWVTCTRFDGTEDVAVSLSISDAAKVLNANQFRERLRRVARFQSVRLPYGCSELQVLPVGYDPLARVYTSHDSKEYSLDWPLARATAYLGSLLSEFPPAWCSNPETGEFLPPSPGSEKALP